jgi:hypothetical protein
MYGNGVFTKAEKKVGYFTKRIADRFPGNFNFEL